MNIVEQMESYLQQCLDKGVVVLSLGMSSSAFREFLSHCAPIDTIDTSTKFSHVRIAELPGANAPFKLCTM